MNFDVIMQNQNMVKICYIYTDSFIVQVRYWYCKDIAEDVETRFDISNFENIQTNHERICWIKNKNI